MTNKIARVNGSEDEINLLDILFNIFSLIKRYILVIIGIIASSVLVGILLYSRASPFYRTRMIADSNNLPNTEIVNIVTSWQDLIAKNDYETLANKLKLEVKTAEKINILQAEDTRTGKMEQTADTNNENSFVISAEVTDVDILDSLQQSIIYALENNEYIKKRAAIKKENIELLKRKITDEIADLDSVKFAFREFLHNGRPASGTFVTSPTDVNLQIVSLYERILTLDASLKLSKDIQVIENFTKTTKPDGPKIAPFIAYSIIAGCFLAVLFIVLKVLSKKIKAYSSSSVYSS